MHVNIDNFMELALEKASEASLAGEVPVGSVIVSPEGEIIAVERNRVEELNDPTAHAEILAIKKACKRLENKCLRDYILIVTLEPCAMCAQAISLAKIGKIYFGAHDIKGGGVINGARIFEHKTCHHSPRVVGGIMEAEAGELLKSFFRAKR